MENKPEVSDESAVIAEQMRDTRSDLSDKLGALEQHLEARVNETAERVAETVEKVTGAVDRTVNSVTETMHEAVESVEEAFDFTRQVKRHPYMMLAGTALVGYVGGCLLNRLAPPRPSASSLTRELASDGHFHNNRAAPEAPRATSSEPGWGDKLADTLKPVMSTVEGLVVNAAAGVLGKMILDAVPHGLQKDVDKAIDDVAVALGGKPARLLEQMEQEAATSPASGDPWRQRTGLTEAGHSL